MCPHRRGKSGISNVIVVMLSLILVVMVVANVVLWSYQMNGQDWDKMREDLEILSVNHIDNGTALDFQNGGPLTCHLIALWIDNSTIHQRYPVNVFINAGERKWYNSTNVNLPRNSCIIKAITERGNVAVFSVV